MYFIVFYNYHSARMLLEYGADVVGESTALMESILNGADGLMIKLLIDHGINEMTEKHGMSPLSFSINDPWLHTLLTTGIIIHPKIGADVPWNDDGAGIGDPSSPHMSKKFVQFTQYRPLYLDDGDLGIILQLVPRPHVVYACPVGHLHSADNCGIPTVLKVCSDDCPFLTGGVHHFLAPGNYIVYHDNYEPAKVWYVNFPVYDYQSYEFLVIWQFPGQTYPQ